MSHILSLTLPILIQYSDLESIYNAIAEARREKNKPTLIRLTTTIGYGSKQQGTHGVHGNREFCQ
jgi:transketolase